MEQPPFHSGEREAQRRAGFRLDGAPIRDAMPDQHRTFFAGLPFIAVGGMTADGSLAAAILCGPPGFVTSPNPRELRVEALPDRDDPLLSLLRPGTEMGLLGLDFATRRRNRVNGRVQTVTTADFSLAVRQSFGNCPKYIRGRRLASPAPEDPPPPGDVEPLDRLDDEARHMVERADTAFVTSSSGLTAQAHGGVDISHRGGPPGFIRIESDTLVVPDFAGNRYFNTIGNFLLHPWAALLFADFASGDLLHLAGAVTVAWQPAAGMNGAQRSWRIEVRSGWRRRSALPLRWISDPMP